MLLHPFDDARLSIERALEHIVEFKSRIQKFLESGPWSMLIEADANGSGYIHKLRFTNSGIDRRIIFPIVDALRNLRSALDLLTAACARLNGAPRLKGVHFPFLDNPSAWSNVVKGRCRCVPHLVTEYFRSLRPYPGGDYELCALAALRNDNDHWALTTIEIEVSFVTIEWTSGRREQVHIPPWPASSVDEVELFTAVGREPDYKLSLVLEIRFDHSTPLLGAPDTVLTKLSKKVGKLIDDTEAIMRAEGFAV